GLYEESRANSEDISSLLQGITRYYNGLADAMEFSYYNSDSELIANLAEGMNEYPGIVIDCYIALSDKTFYDGGGWVPGADYDPTTRAWYIDGLKASSIILGPPSLDMTTGDMVVCGSRYVKFPNGKEGVISIDIALAGISENVNTYTPGGSGRSCLIGNGILIAYPESSYVGKSIKDYSDNTFLSKVGEIAAKGGSEEVLELKGSDGKTYLVAITPVDDTDWVLVSYVNRSDVLKVVTSFTTLSAGMAVVMVLIASVIMGQVIRKMITKPVSDLTKNITSIANGDFTIEIPEGGGNEIGVMNNSMHDYVMKMRATLVDLKNVTAELSKEADSSKEASGELNKQADEQSLSMEQIRKVMDDMSYAVADLAEQATSLAQEVSNLTEKSETTKETMDVLVTKARDGQRDMNAVQNGMNAISVSMQNMGDVVAVVDESAHKINSIIDMINSISSQTNLLSLNASIEAARAGEAGKGFAVVANEIGQLANNSAESTAQISAIISDITSQIADLSKKSKENMEEIKANMEAVTTAGNTFEEIFERLDETSDIVKDMIAKVGSVDGIATSMAAISEEQSASTEEVTATATSLSESAKHVAEKSQGVDNSATSVSEAATRIETFTDMFKV
ncbi:MAG: methyl-accepting chemotaxis protein, partial [Lachnospiraceae bacterium]|nr:methyl-accepting chemotaxis protein [Lachnospiraceae bacterium]